MFTPFSCKIEGLVFSKGITIDDSHTVYGTFENENIESAIFAVSKHIQQLPGMFVLDISITLPNISISLFISAYKPL